MFQNFLKNFIYHLHVLVIYCYITNPETQWLKTATLLLCLMIFVGQEFGQGLVGRVYYFEGHWQSNWWYSAGNWTGMVGPRCLYSHSGALIGLLGKSGSAGMLVPTWGICMSFTQQGWLIVIVGLLTCQLRPPNMWL